VRQYVRLRKQALGLRVGPEPCVPQQYAWGDEAQVDWYKPKLTWMASGRRCRSSRCAAWPVARRSTARTHARRSGAFLKAHELAFQHLGGVYRQLRYDNLGSAVKKILRGHRREETARFVAFRSHWRFESSFCTPGEGHEKGGIEGEVGYFRRNHWVPVPSARDLDELNAMLLAGCRADGARTIDGRPQMVGEAHAIEREHLLPLPSEGFDLMEVSFAHVDGLRRVRVRTNAYSAPLWPGTTVQVKAQHTPVVDRCACRRRSTVALAR
jgi:hypothetical protein